MPPRKVAILTAGGLAPCLSAATGGLIERYTALAPEIELICYRNGYKGLLMGDKIPVADDLRDSARILRHYGGSPIGNSRVKLTNIKDCVKRGLVKEGQDPLAVAAEQLRKDGVDVLHTIGGDDTNTTAADLAAYLHKEGHELTVIGLPKTIDNDIIPIRQSLGALTAEQNKLLALTPTEELLALPMLQPDKITDSLHAYQISKRGNSLRVMAEAVRWGQRGARVNTISPGIIMTPLAKDELSGPRGAGYRRMIELCPAGRAGTPDEVGNVGALLMGADGAFITGSDFLMDGGVTAAYWFGELAPK